MMHVLLLLALPSSSLCAEITLPSANDFTDFVSKVNSGSNYSGTTVCLDSDITLVESVDPIGNDTSNCFRGVFDGKGHVINNLQINSSSRYTGLFGYSTGLIIRNVVLDDSCSMTSAYSNSGHAFIGGIIGYCDASQRQCNIENSVNMAGVTFSGTISGSNSLFIGGVAGRLYSSNYGVHVKNCVNYGSVTDSGIASKYAELGGLVGVSQRSSSTYNTYIQNCLNYGTITHNETSANLYIGGIVGYGASYTYIENCVSAGNILTSTTASGINYIGGIVGKVNTDTHINYCYYTSDVGINSINGTGSPTITGTPDSATDVDSGLVSKLNSNATSCSWDNWFMLHLNGGSINNLTQDLLIGIQGQIPNPVKEGYTQSWYKDAECTEEFDPETESASGITDLYAGWTPNNYTVTFDTNGGNVSGASKIVTFSKEYGDLPEPNRTGYIFTGWFDEKNEILTNEKNVTTPKNHTLYAKWTANNYTVTFNVSGGNVLPNDETTKIVTFDEKYGELPKPNRTEYMFLGWFGKSNELTTNVTIVTTPDNHTLYAHWEEVTNWLEIVFNKKDLSKEEVKNIIKKYTKADFEIIRFENESGELTVIIEFVDKKDAENFVENIKSDWDDDIKEINFIIIGSNRSFSLMIYPLSFLNSFFL